MSVNESRQSGMSPLMRWMMGVCCALMLAPVMIFFAGGGSIGDASGFLGALLPIALCIGMHFVLHRFAGTSCHKAAAEPNHEIDPASGQLTADENSAVRPRS